MTRGKMVLIVVSVLMASLVVAAVGGIFLIRQISRMTSGGLGGQAVVRGKPLPCGAEALTSKQVEPMLVGYYRKQLGEAYRQHGRHSPAWDKAAEELLEAVALSAAGVKDAPTPEDVKPLVAALVRADCDDPLVLARIGHSYMNAGQAAEAESYLLRALKGLKQQGYPPLPVAWAYHDVAQLKGEVGRSLESADFKWRPQAIAAYVEAAGQSFGPHEQRALWAQFNRLLENDFRRSQAAIIRGLQDQPGTDPWILNMAQGRHWFDYAVFCAGGEDYILLAQGKKLEDYQKYLAEARPYFAKAAELHPDYPEPFGFMILVARGETGAGERPRDWFDRAVAAQFDFMSAYYDMHRALHPWWGGSRSAQLAFAKECLDTGRFDTDVPMMYQETVFMISGSQGETDTWKNSEVWPNLQAYYEGALAEAARSSPDSVKPLRTLYALMGWRTGHPDVSLSQIQALKGQLDRATFDQVWGERMELFVGEVYALASPNKQQIEAAEALYDQQRVPEALAAFDKLLAQEKSRQVQFYLRDRLQTLRWEKDFEAGKWVDLKPTPDLVGWDPWQGTFEPLKDGTGFIVRPAPETFALMVCHLRPDQWYEIKCDVEFPAEKVEGIEAGFVVDISASSANPYYDSFRIIRSPATGYCGGGWSMYREHALGEVPRKLQMRLVQCDNRITMYMNDTCVFQDQELTDRGYRFEGAHHVGIGGETYPDPTKPVIYRNIKIHKMK